MSKKKKLLLKQRVYLILVIILATVCCAYIDDWTFGVFAYIIAVPSLFIKDVFIV